MQTSVVIPTQTPDLLLSFIREQLFNTGRGGGGSGKFGQWLGKKRQPIFTWMKKSNPLWVCKTIQSPSSSYFINTKISFFSWKQYCYNIYYKYCCQWCMKRNPTHPQKFLNPSPLPLLNGCSLKRFCSLIVQIQLYLYKLLSSSI